MKDNFTTFWHWFQHSKFLFEKLEISQDSINLIDKQITTLGDFAWEIGPGKNKEYSLTLSPGGDKSLLSLTKSIVSKAPVIDNWEFHYAKPIKEWENYFEVFFKNEKISIDISKWQYVLFRNKDNAFDIDVRVSDVPVILQGEAEEMHGIVEMVVESIIGEEARLEKIDRLEIVKEFDNKSKKGITAIPNLLNHIQKLNSIKPN
ncbi:MAG TPA: hypothetical protein VF476_00375 [Chitinophagaceae bacterium]